MKSALLNFFPKPAVSLFTVAALMTLSHDRSQIASGQAQTKSSIVGSQMLISAESLVSRLNEPNLIVLHVARDKTQYDAGHLPGARFLPLSDILTTRDNVPNELPTVEKLQQVFSSAGVGDDSRVVLYDENAGLLAARAWFTLDYLGFGERAALLDGGLEQWKAEKRPLSRTAPEIVAAKFTPRVNPRVLVLRQAVQEASRMASENKNAQTVLLDARPAEEFAGTKPGNGQMRAGHIPGAISLYWMQTVTAKEKPVLKSISELRKMYEAAGAAPGSRLITYCHSGVQAAHAYFTAKYLGYEVTLYDGSFIDWNNQQDAPVSTSGKKP